MTTKRRIVMEPSALDRGGWQRDLHWASVFLRASLGSLFLAAGIAKMPGGVAGTVGYYSSLFEHSLLPRFLVEAHASVIMFVELALALWLLSGYRLALAWKSAAVVLLSLAVGMLFAGKTDVASDNYVYVALALGGLLTARFDRWVPQRVPADVHPSELTPSADHAHARS
jgi:hypothetical protein